MQLIKKALSHILRTSTPATLEKEAIVGMLEEVVAKVDSALMAACDSADTSAVRNY